MRKKIERASAGIRMACAALMVLGLSGCMATIPPEAFENANYGPPPPANYKEIIKADFAPMLIDPTSPLYEFGEPSKGYTNNTRLTFGWKVCGTINTKNRMGGYTGRLPFFTLFKDGHVVTKAIGKVTTDKYGMNFQNSAVNAACRRTVPN